MVFQDSFQSRFVCFCAVNFPSETTFGYPISGTSFIVREDVDGYMIMSSGEIDDIPVSVRTPSFTHVIDGVSDQVQFSKIDSDGERNDPNDSEVNDDVQVFRLYYMNMFPILLTRYYFEMESMLVQYGNDSYGMSLDTLCLEIASGREESRRKFLLSLVATMHTVHIDSDYLIIEFRVIFIGVSDCGYDFLLYSVENYYVENDRFPWWLEDYWIKISSVPWWLYFFWIYKEQTTICTQKE